MTLTATLVSHTDSGTRGPLGEYIETPVESVFPILRHRGLRAQETPEWLTNIATQVWKTTAPYSDTVASAKPDDQIRVGDQIYSIIGGVQIFPDQNGDLRKGVVTFLTKRQEG